MKQSAAWQTWDPFKQAASGLPPKDGPGIFDIAPRTGWFDAAGAVWTAEAGRPAHVYILAWNGFVAEAADHRNSDQWEFFIVPADGLPAQKTLSLRRLKAIKEIAGPFIGPKRGAEALVPYSQRENATAGS